MPSQLASWEVYNKYDYPLCSCFPVCLMRHRALGPLKYGDALWSILFCSPPPRSQSEIDCREPGPIYRSYRRVRPGDVGFIRRGQFHLLFSAAIPIGSRELGVDVPHTFEQLYVGPIVSRDRRLPGYLSTDTVRQVGVDVGGSAAVALCV